MDERFRYMMKDNYDSNTQTESESKNHAPRLCWLPPIDFHLVLLLTSVGRFAP